MAAGGSWDREFRRVTRTSVGVAGAGGNQSRHFSPDGNLGAAEIKKAPYVGLVRDRARHSIGLLIGLYAVRKRRF